jgi:transposase
MRGYELSDFEWGVIALLLPNKPRGVPRVDDQRVLNGIFRVLRAGAPWRAPPKEFGPQTTCHNRFVRWRKDGVWDRLLAAVTTAYDGNVQMIDSTSVPCISMPRTQKSHPDRCMGRSRGGLTTKIHALTDANGLPLELMLTPGQAGDCPVAARLLGHLRQDTIVLADKAYDADWLCRQIEAAGAAPNIPPMVHRRWKPCFSPVLYRARNRVERFFNRIKHFPTPGHPLREARFQLPRHAQAGCNTPLATP